MRDSRPAARIRSLAGPSMYGRSTTRPRTSGVLSRIAIVMLPFPPPTSMIVRAEDRGRRELRHVLHCLSELRALLGVRAVVVERGRAEHGLRPRVAGAH